MRWIEPNELSEMSGPRKPFELRNGCLDDPTTALVQCIQTVLTGTLNPVECGTRIVTTEGLAGLIEQPFNGTNTRRQGGIRMRRGQPRVNSECLQRWSERSPLSNPAAQHPSLTLRYGELCKRMAEKCGRAVSQVLPCYGRREQFGQGRDIASFCRVE